MTPILAPFVTIALIENVALERSSKNSLAIASRCLPELFDHDCAFPAADFLPRPQRRHILYIERFLERLRLSRISNRPHRRISRLAFAGARNRTAIRVGNTPTVTREPVAFRARAFRNEK